MFQQLNKYCVKTHLIVMNRELSGKISLFSGQHRAIVTSARKTFLEFGGQYRAIPGIARNRTALDILYSLIVLLDFKILSNRLK